MISEQDKKTNRKAGGHVLKIRSGIPYEVAPPQVRFWLSLSFCNSYWVKLISSKRKWVRKADDLGIPDALGFYGAFSPWIQD